MPVFKKKKKSKKRTYYKKSQKKKVKVPDGVRPYIFHGMNLDWENDDDPKDECPWCGKEKFSVNVASGLSRCLVCGISSDGSSGLNPMLFIRELHSLLRESTTSDMYDELAESRGLLSGESLKAFGLVYHAGTWLVPAYTSEKKLSQLYRYGDTCYPTPTLSAQMFGANTVNTKHKVLNVTEGVWDAVAFYEMLKVEGLKESVVGLPGILGFKDEWLKLFSKFDTIVVLQDNDHPNEVDGMERGLGGIKGVSRIASTVKSLEDPPEVKFLKWGEEGYNKDLENKCDVRDVLNLKVSL